MQTSRTLPLHTVLGAWSPTSLKLWFDQLSTLLAEKINAIYDALSGESAAEYMPLMLDGLRRKQRDAGIQLARPMRRFYKRALCVIFACL